jgi:hypothetical protein
MVPFSAYLGHTALSGLLLCLIVVLIVTALVFVVGQHLAPAYAGICAFIVFLLGVVVCLFG